MQMLQENAHLGVPKKDMVDVDAQFFDVMNEAAFLL